MLSYKSPVLLSVSVFQKKIVVLTSIMEHLDHLKKARAQLKMKGLLTASENETSEPASMT